VEVSPDGTDLTSAGPASRALPLSGQLVGGRYRVEALVGEGGMGAVYRAQHVSLRKPVALKVLHPDLTLLPDIVARFEREAVLSARIQHPHVVAATDFGRLDSGPLYLVLEYIWGPSLRRILEVERRLNSDRALAIATQIAEALAAAHAAGVVHRDLKPENVMLVRTESTAAGTTPVDDFIKVLDFGIAKVLGGNTSDPQTRHGAVFGTPEYMAPEQARGQPIDYRADLYALGVLLYELLVGEVPFRGPDPVAVLVQQVQSPPPALPAAFPAPLANIVHQLLAKDPAERPDNAGLVAEKLRELRQALRNPDSKRLVPATTPAPAPSLEPEATPPIEAGSARRTRQRGSLAPGSPSFGAAPWYWTGALVVFTLLGSLTLGGNKPNPEPSLPNLLQIVEKPAVLENARQGDSEALQALSTTPPRQRDDEHWLALAAGLHTNGDDSAALHALEEGIAAEPSLASDRRVLSLVRAAVNRNATREGALKLAATRLGTLGVDLLFDVWASTADKTPATRSAKTWLDRAEVRARASAPLKLAFELRDTRGCDNISKILPKVRKNGDARCAPRLQRLAERQGCGFFGLHDCYPCLRNNDSLARALAAVKDRPAPAFE
jgi:eukaryotic-like serine/threonine-protein kinase